MSPDAIIAAAGAATTTSATEPRPASPIRVLLWSPGGAGDHYFGPGTYAHRLYAAASRDRFAVTLAHGLPEHGRSPVYVAQHLIAPALGSPLTAMRFLRASRRWLDQHAARFDVFHGLVGYHATVAPAAHAQRLGLPAVIRIANQGQDLGDKPGLRRLLGLPRRRREMAKRLSGIIAMGQAIHDELRGYGIPERLIARIPKSVDTAVFSPADEAERRRLRQILGWPDRPTIVFMGGLVRRKRPHLIVEAAALLASRGRELQVVLVGPAHDAEYVAQMRALAADAGIADHLLLPGFTTDVAPLYRASDLFSLPSANEGMPGALVEALSTGLPSIVTPFEGAADVLQDGRSGRIVDPTAEALAEAIGQYLDSPSLAAAHGRAARELVLARFSMEAGLALHEALFRRIMAGGDAAG